MVVIEPWQLKQGPGFVIVYFQFPVIPLDEFLLSVFLNLESWPVTMETGT